MTATTSTADRSRRIALALFVGLLVIYNTNGREVGTVDSQPAKFTAREIAVKHTLTLDRVIAERPLLAERPAFGRDRQGHYRSSYPMLPALIASIPATLLHKTGLVDMDAPLAPNLIAVITASLLTAGAVTLVFLAIRRITRTSLALVTAIGLGIGTNYWPVVSRTLWQHETVAFGLALALWAWLKPTSAIRTRELVLGGIGLAMAAAARPQVAVSVIVLLSWLAFRTNIRRAVLPAAIVAATGVLVVATNLYWFGHVLGGVAALEAVHPQVHNVPGSISREPWIGALGLLISPSRGLLVFSPIVLVAFAAIGEPVRSRRELRLGWLGLAVLLQFVAYAFYSVWWGGHTYGPRYMIDVLVPLAPLAALGVERISRDKPAAAVAGLLLAWSVLVAGVGAFVYPNERWNVDPSSVDRDHERLWQVGDSQILRALDSPASPQNQSLYDWGTVRQQ